MAFLIADGLVLAVLLIFACIGARRGLILSLCGLLAFVVAFLGASFAARTLSPVVADALEPKFAAAIEEQLNESIRQQAEAGEAAVLSPDDVPLEGVLDALREMGFYETLINTVDRAVESGMTAVAASAAAAVAAAIAQSAAYLILFLLGFFLILLAWRLLSRALDLAFRLPVLSTLNSWAGAGVGLLKGGLLLFVAAWLLGDFLPPEAVQGTVLLRFFCTTSPLSLIV